MRIKLSIPPLFRKKDRRLGVARERRQYDLPLSTDESTVFLALLIALMTFLAIMAISSTFALGAMTSHWSKGLDKRATIEIPAQTQEGKVLEKGEIAALQKHVQESLLEIKAVASIDVVDDQQVHAMVSPWLGDNFVIDDLPFPAILSLHLHEESEAIFNDITETLSKISPAIRLDTHEAWLSDLFRLSSALRFAALVITVIIGLTTVTAIAGAVRSRMAIYRSDIELLHLMGARDNYIMKQFQRHALILAIKGAIIGASIAVLVLLVINWLAGDLGYDTIIGMQGLSFENLLIILTLPFVICLISALTARHTVLRVLTLMP